MKCKQLLEQEEITLTDALKVLLDDLLSLQDSQRIQHWNVTGSSFGSLHLIYQNLYVLCNDAQDQTAERIRYYGEQVSIEREDVIEPTDRGSNYVLYIVRRIQEMVELFDWFYENQGELDKDLVIGLHRQMAQISYLIASHN